MKKNNPLFTSVVAASVIVLSHCGEDKSAANSANQHSGADYASKSDNRAKTSTKSSSDRDSDSGEKQPQINNSEAISGAAVSAEWRGQSPLAVMQELKNAGEWKSKKGEFFQQWGSFDPMAAIQHVKDNEERGSSTALKGQVVAGWASNDLRAAQRWISSQQKNAERSIFITQAVTSVLNGTNQGEISEISTWLASEVDIPGIQNPIAQYTSHWIQSDSEAALSWAQEHTEGSKISSSVTRNILNKALQMDPTVMDGVTDWLTNAPSSPFRDDMIYAYVTKLGSSDPEISRAWIDIIQDPETKAKADLLFKNL